MSSSVLAPVEIEYPSADGRPVAESDFQLNSLIYARERLRIYFRDECKRDDVYVAGNLLIYYEEGNPRRSVAPDVFAVVGWQAMTAPRTCSGGSARHPTSCWRSPRGPRGDEDQGRKRERYRTLGVKEYWQYDPTGDYLQPPLQGLELVAGSYVRMPGRQPAAGTLALASRVLGLELHLTKHGLRYHDPVTGKYLLSHAESEAARQAAEASLAEAAGARQAAEARGAALEARLRDRGGAERLE